jgi:filamentous hemagglutinin family protein
MTPHDDFPAAWSRSPSPSQRVLLVLLPASLLLAGLYASSMAQMQTTITPDRTLGTRVTQTNQVYTIQGGTIKGPNQFHSFDRFRLGTGDTANFTGPAGIVNIISRVTGPERSDIDGRLQSTMAGASLYLLNPHGVVFGPNATLDVQGSFHVSTADYLRFADGTTLAAHPGGPSTLTIAAPTAFGFWRHSPAEIAVNNSMLHAAPGATVSLVGGNILVIGREAVSEPPPQVAAPGGRIIIASVAGAGEVPLPATGPAPVLDLSVFPRLGTIQLGQGTRLDTSGESGGTVLIRGGQLWMDGGTVTARTRNSPGASIGIDMQVRDTAVLTNKAAVITAVESGGTGKAGAIQIAAGRLEVREGAVVSSRAVPGPTSASLTQGAPGDVRITGGSVVVTGEGSLLESNAMANTSGDVGQITITAPTLTVEHRGAIRSPVRGTGAGGTVVIQADQLTLTDGGRIEANVTTGSSGADRPGRITVTAREHVTIDGANSGQNTGLFSQTAGSNRAAGTISVQTGHLAVMGGGQISTSTSRDGNAGRVQITAQEVTLSGPGSQLTSTTTGTGNAGQVDLQVGRLMLTEGAQIDTGAGPAGNAGTIIIRASEAVTLASTAATEARLVSRAAGSGFGGQVTITAPRVEVASGGRISVIALQDGQDGKIDLAGTRVLTGGRIDKLSEIVLDGSLGPGMVLEGADITIDAALGQIHGSNLFQSFSRFRLLPGSTVTFTGPSYLTTILSRVTGAEPALLEGMLRSDIPGAALFFLAPHGVLFGAGAQLDWTGAVHISTADLLRLDDGGRFWGSLTTPSILTTGTPMAFGFTTFSPEPITLRMESWPLNALPGSQLSLLGGDITLVNGTLQAPGAVLSLVSVASPGEVQFAPSGGSQVFHLAEFAQQGNLILAERTRLTTSGEPEGSANTGVIEIHAAHVAVLQDAEIAADASGQGSAGRIAIDAETLTVTDGRIAASTQGVGNAGEITIRVGQLAVTDGGLIAATQDVRTNAAAGSGHGGSIRIVATDVHIGGPNATQQSRIEASTDGSGTAGMIDVQVQRLRITDGGLIRTGSNLGATGAGGILRVTATNEVMVMGSGEIHSPTGGDTMVQVVPSELSSSTRGGGTGGRIEVQAARIVLKDGGRINSETRRTGQGGDINLRAATLEMTGGSEIVAASTGGSNAGSITIIAEATQNTGSDVRETVRERVWLRESKITTAVSGGAGGGGNIAINAEFLILENSQITADAMEGTGGNITVTADVFLANPASRVTASSALNVDGEINIQAPIANLSGLVTPLPLDLAPAAVLLRDPCPARLHAGTVSSLVVRERASLPATFDSVLPGRLYEPLRSRTPSSEVGPRLHKRTAASQVSIGTVAAGSPWRLALPCPRP